MWYSSPKEGHGITAPRPAASAQPRPTIWCSGAASRTSMFVMPYLQAFHLDLDFYDAFFQPGAYLHTRAEHLKNWHG
jgi:hypothetical protein